MKLLQWELFLSGWDSLADVSLSDTSTGHPHGVNFLFVIVLFALKTISGFRLLTT